MDKFEQMDKQKEEDFKYLMDRIKKLTEAIYRVTELYPDKEPLKWSLREKVVSLYEKMMSLFSFKDNKIILSNRVISQSLDDILENFIKIINTLDLSFSDGFISGINFEILKREFSALKSFIEGEKDSFLEGQKFLISPKDEQNKENKKFQKKEPSFNGHNVHNNHNGHNEKRQAMILDFLKKRGKANIREISSIFENVGIKSIQRDLLDLVRTHQLRTEGEKRWRIYFLDQI
ncbi:MAG: hypothetical protein AB1643_00075 [Patescibacteria group bacterium]